MGLISNHIQPQVRRLLQLIFIHKIRLYLHLQERNVKRLLADGRLAYLYPSEINHPRQRYIANELS
jgi:hypothetical protein